MVVEEVLEGPEVSAFALCDGADGASRSTLSQDFKRIGDGDVGPEHRRDGRVLAAPVRRPPTEAAHLAQIVGADVRGDREPRASGTAGSSTRA